MTKKLERQLRTAARLTQREVKQIDLHNYDCFWRLSGTLRRVVEKGQLPEGATKDYLVKVREELEEAHRRMYHGYSDYAARLHALATLLGVQ